MPIYVYKCINGHEQEAYEGLSDKGCETVICEKCMNTMGSIISPSKPLLFFEEGKGRWIHNLGHEPVYVTSYEQHKREMKKAGVTFATPRKGKKGSWL